MSSNDVFLASSSINSAKVNSPQESETIINPNPNPNPSAKKRRNLPGTPDPDAEVIALSPKSLMAKNRFICEICNKGFQREQNLQLHRRGHNLPWKLKQRSNKDPIRKKVYICPEKTCVHHDPGRALGDLTGVKKHFSRKHGEKKWKCEKCGKKYAVQSDWKAHSKTCGTREYKCDCGTIFSRKDSFTTHRAFCDALAEERSKFTSFAPNSFNFSNHDLNANLMKSQLNSPHGFANNSLQLQENHHQQIIKPRLPLWLDYNQAINSNHHQLMNPTMDHDHHNSSLFMPSSSNALPDMQMAANDNFFNSNFSPSSAAPPFSATSLLQKAAQMGSIRSSHELNWAFSQPQENTAGGDSTPGSTFSSSTTSANINNILDHHQSMIQSSAGSTAQILHSGLHGVEHSSTRDFLGVGGGAARPFSPQEATRFASLSAASGLGLSHFSANH